MKKTLSEYILHRLAQLGVKHMFGVPSDYTLGFMTYVENSSIQLIGCCNELNAGYAADAYARVNGLGSFCVSCYVGAFSALNAITGSQVEKVPVVIILGNPKDSNKNSDIMFHHVPENRNLQTEVFQKVVKRVIQVAKNQNNVALIDEALQFCIREKEPIVIELPSDLNDLPCEWEELLTLSDKKSSAQVLPSVVLETLRAAQKPLIMAGIEINRLKQEENFLQLLKVSGINYVTPPLGKTIIDENHPQFCGVYWGQLSQLPVIKYVEASDVIVTLGAWKTDINLGFMTANLSQAKIITVAHDQLVIGNEKISFPLDEFIPLLTQAFQNKNLTPITRAPVNFSEALFFKGDKTLLTMDTFFSRMKNFMTDNKLIIADVGETLIGTMNMRLGKNTRVLCQGLYQSIGYAVPATLGAALGEKEGRQLICFYGDGSFQLTAQEVSTIIAQGCKPIMFLLNNKGYLVERVFLDGKYNDITNWQYHQLPAIFGDCFTAEIFTEEELENTLQTIHKLPPQPCFVEVHLPQLEHCEAMLRLAHALKK